MAGRGNLGTWHLWRSFPRALVYLRPYWLLGLVVILATLVLAAVGLAQPWPLALLVDGVLGEEDPPALLADLVGTDKHSLLLFAVAFGFGLTLLGNALTLLNEYVGTKLEQRMVLDLRSDLFDHCQRLSLTFHDKTMTGELMSKINDQAASVGSVVMTIPPLAQSLLTLVGMFAIVYHIDRSLAIIALVCVVRLLLHPITKKSQINMMRFGKKMQKMAPEMQKLQKKYDTSTKEGRQKMQQEQMRLMREHGVNPLQAVGCLPLFLQIPIWIALYAMLYFAFDLRQEPAFFGIFQWITGGAWPFLADLASGDHFLGEFSDEDHVLLVLDTFQDGRSGFVFACNASGARFDGIVVSQGEEANGDWDAIWEGRVTRDETGWTAEFRIPARSLGFRPDLTSWGFNVQRRVPRLQETSRWASPSRDYEIFQTIRAGLLAGLPRFDTGAGLSVRPSSVGRATKAGKSVESTYDGDPSLDVTKTLGPNLLSSLTINTDQRPTLRVGALSADWPHGLLNIPIGTFNTAVLIISSVTVVMAWASLKMKQFGRFKIYQSITVLCALTFLGIKSFEYRDKFTHYEVWKNDGTRVTGHLEGKPMFLTLDKVKASGKTSIAFTPDGAQFAAGMSDGRVLFFDGE